ncbi:MAG: chemotaxis protein CheB [Candidatus Polarisedimenticolia bacterium]|nr:response regulator [bacterium]
MDDTQLPGDAFPEPDEDEGRASAAAAPECNGAARPAVPVVGVGASAGGLEVFKRLLGDLPADTGFASVFVQHLDPSHPSMLAEILARATSMPVSEAADGMPLEANHVYVIPANADLTLEHGALALAPRTQTPGSHMPIDLFFRSLANECGGRAIGVILSGTGTDGSAGVEAVKAAGGVTFAQDASTAKFATMPQAAAATGCVDFVLPPEEIAAELVRIGRHPYIADDRRAPQERGPAADEECFGAILAMLHGATGIDFSLYRERMIRRRVLRRLALRNIGDLAAYRDRLAGDPDEMQALQRDLLISVTSFFRDRESFESLKKTVFPRIFRARTPNDPVRVWVAGCATGEEAFSIAISLREYMDETGAAFPVQIFASDISSSAIDKARTGRFLENIAADLTPDRLNRHFTKIEGGYQIDKNLREMCVFTKHNLIADPPFSKLDLISCRNVLIYLGSVQKSIVPLFHYALKPGGFLMLGASEGTAAGDLFSAVDRGHRIYAKREAARPPHLFRPTARAPRRDAPGGGEAAAGAPWGGADLRKEVDRILLSRYSPAGVVVDAELEVQELRGRPGPYLALPLGKASFHLMKLIPDAELFLEVEKLIQRARTSGKPTRQERVPYEHDGIAACLNVEAIPLDPDQGGSTLVLFEATSGQRGGEAAPTEAPPAGDVRDRQIARLKQHLAAAREQLLAAMEAHQTAAEDSQNTTEEALSANEELQSLNEELETAKEELQSTNEELVTVNDELQAKNAALAQARDFAMSIVETVRQPLLVLDAELRIRMANRAFCSAFQTSPFELQGRLVYTLARGGFDLPGLRAALGDLRRGNASFPDFEAELDFPRVGRRSLVFGGCRLGPLQMTLLAVDDVTERKTAQQALRKSEEHLRQAQKMEAVGRLAGGIAHDFNNLLTAILGYSSLLRDQLAGDDLALQQVLEITKASERAASLTQQLLAFSRRQVLQPKVLDLNAIVADFDRMLRRLADERITVVVECAPDLWRVRADPGELGRAIMNLALNARDAMPEGGTLTVSTANATLTEADAAGRDLPPGRYALMAVSDTGEGMDEDVRAHIFEPFFTTKETGKGTGLGLATVLGIVEQSGGAIRCESEPGEGTTFTILLPAVAEAQDAGPRPTESLAAVPKGSEVVLLVEDEEMVRVLARRVLETRGYVVHEAGNGREGLELCRTHEGPIDLLVSDVVMPELGGRELAERALVLRPGLKVLFMSGHTQDVLLKEGVERGAPFLQKPFTPAGLAQKVRETLDSAPRPAERRPVGAPRAARGDDRTSS